ncbi:MAG: exodeoxyribonuclease VII small subunit [Tissierellia bacterium]|nr:exodeoxyribonuclease VII small subunit [Tissierellia bacterium]
MTFKYEEANERLKEIVEEMESGDLSLEAMVDKYEEGMALYKALSEKLEGFKQRVLLLQEDQEGQEVVSDYEEDI